jgi:cytochrome d ubiquinol oxidase subunit II
VISWLGAIASNRFGREGWAFLFSAVTQGSVVIFLFCALYPYVMPSSIQPAASLTITNASSTEYTLKVMTVVAVILTPLVLVYQAWSYWVFRRRLHPDQIPDPGHGSLDLPHEVTV